MVDINTLRELYDARRLDEAWGEYVRLHSDGPLGAEGHLLGGLTARLLGDLRGARRALERGLDSAPSGRILGQLRMTLGATLREIGETTAPIEMLELFLAGMDQYPELRHVATGAGHYNLALAYRCARRFDDAKKAYEVAIREFSSENMRDYLRQTLQNLAWLCCMTGDIARADETLNEADGLCDTEQARWQQRISTAFLLFASGEKTHALERCESIIKADESAPAAVISSACWIAGRAAVELGQLEQAQVMADQALTWALKAKEDARPMQDASALRVEITKAMVHRNQTGA